MPGNGEVPLTSALISVSNKAGLEELAAELKQMKCRLVSTGGTARFLRQLGHVVTEVSDVTGFPEIMDGRVKTLHPKIHGGILSAAGNQSHEREREIHGIGLFDLLVVNLYPFEETLRAGGAPDDVIENIDIGGPALIRAGAKNHGRVAVLTDPTQYSRFVGAVKAAGGATTPDLRRALAAEAFTHTASYDAAISRWMTVETSGLFPETLIIKARLAQNLRYGENPHQRAAAYRLTTEKAGILDALQVQGKELSYNNINDADAALEAVSEFSASGRPACVIVKHANPCGAALGATPLEAYQRALTCDPVSAFGGILAFNCPLDEATASEISKIFTEVILAPGASKSAQDILAAKKNLRLLLLPSQSATPPGELAGRFIRGGLLLQTPDQNEVSEDIGHVVSQRAPTPDERRDLSFAWKLAKHVKSNAIVFAKNECSTGIGAGQMSRIDSTRIAHSKSLDAAKALGFERPLCEGSVLASDAFFPFPDGLEAAAQAGATAIIQPGGAQRDADVINAADRLGLAMIFTGQRHFRH